MPSTSGARKAAEAASQWDYGLEPERTTFYTSWVVEKTGGIARYVHGPLKRPTIYYKGNCIDCSTEFVRVRTPRKHKAQGNGRWPVYCEGCYAARVAASNAGGADRTRRMRERRSEAKKRNDAILGRTWGGKRRGAGRKPKESS